MTDSVEGVAAPKEELEEKAALEEQKKQNEAASMVLGLPYVGGIKRKETKVLVEGVALCKECGASKGSFVKYDNVLEVFHMPLWRWPGRNPALVCSYCRHWLCTSHFEPLPTPALENDDLDLIHPPSPRVPEREIGSWHCWSCSHLLQSPTFKFCPTCGSRQNFW